MTYEQDRDAAAEKQLKQLSGALLEQDEKDELKAWFEVGANWSRDYWTRWRDCKIELPKFDVVVWMTGPEWAEPIMAELVDAPEGCYWVDIYGDDLTDPTHWLPIPPLPQTGGGNNGLV